MGLDGNSVPRRIALGARSLKQGQALTDGRPLLHRGTRKKKEERQGVSAKNGPIRRKTARNPREKENKMLYPFL